MKRKYESRLLENMHQNQKNVSFKGVPVLVKPIPEGGEAGDIDPRMYKGIRFLPILARFIPKQKKTQTTLEQIAPLRKMFNKYKGILLIEEGVETKHVKVESTDGYLVPVRIYKRTNAGAGLPILVYYHGGGFFGGGPDIVEQMCKLLVQKLDCVVLNVDYRLCPEHHYPQPFDDCWYVTRWAFEQAEELGASPEKIAVAGDSAGGNLAAAISLRDREEKTGMVKLQVLLYPAVNIAGKHTEFYQGVQLDKYRRSRRHGKALNAMLGLMGNMMGADGKMLDNVYLQGHIHPEHIYASPLLDDMHDLPQTLLMFGEHDFLAFEDFAYAQTAVKAGVSIRTIIYEGMNHGFADQIGVLPQAEDCIEEIVRMMQDCL